jgi:uncharacterized Fe-S cluster-containing radical SAM superfamily protein
MALSEIQNQCSEVKAAELFAMYDVVDRHSISVNHGYVQHYQCCGGCRACHAFTSNFATFNIYQRGYESPDSQTNGKIMNRIFEESKKTMENVLGYSIDMQSRETRFIFARDCIVYHLIKRNTFTLEEIGKMIGKDHSTVSHIKTKMNEMIGDVRFYPSENELWNDFQQQIKN